MQPLWTSVWRFLKKPKLELPYDPDIALDISLEEYKSKQHQDPLHIHADLGILTSLEPA